MPARRHVRKSSVGLYTTTHVLGQHCPDTDSMAITFSVYKTGKIVDGSQRFLTEITDDNTWTYEQS